MSQAIEPRTELNTTIIGTHFRGVFRGRIEISYQKASLMYGGNVSRICISTESGPIFIENQALDIVKERV